MIGPGGFGAAPRLQERPQFGTAPIRCGKTKCKWRGFETELREVHNARWTQHVCPTCGCESYSFMTPKEIQAWERKKALNQAGVHGMDKENYG